VVSVRKMAKPPNVSAAKSEGAVRRDSKSADFVKWGKDFFAYLQGEKGDTK
jgi:hypothetical protein